MKNNANFNIRGKITAILLINIKKINKKDK